MNSKDSPTPDWQLVRRLFDEALGLPVGERDAFLAALDVDPGVRAELQSLLAHHIDDTGADPLRAGPAGAQLRASLNREGERFGAWEIVKVLGSGGMGEVFQARRVDGSFVGFSAIKVLKRGMDSTAVLERFSHERHILGRLEHPHIARIMDAGLSVDGLPYFVMEYVDGVPIDMAARSLPLEARLALVLQLTDAVAYAHRQLLVHRDLKPGNVLVTAQGQVKLLDFGIAKAIDPLGGEGAEATLDAQRAFTPNYASPEQVRGERVGTATDIYSLGVLLYQLLTGVRPTGRDAATPAEAARSVLDEAPTRPSSLAEGTVDDPQWLATRARLQGDLDNILLKALEKPADRRYETVDALAQDLRNYLAGFPVSARAASRGYVLSKFVRRHRALVAASTLALLAMLGGLAGTAWQAHRAELALEVAQLRLKDIRSLSKDMVVRYGDAVTHLPGGLKLKEQLLTDNLGYLDRLLAESGDDPALRGEIAMAYARLADVQVDNGLNSMQRDEAGARNAERALRMFADTESVAPNDAAFYLWWGRSYKAHARTLRAGGKLDGALAELAAADVMLRRGLARFPSNSLLRQEFGSILFMTGQMKDTLVLASKGRGDEALAAFDQAHAIYLALATDKSSAEPYADVFQLGTIEGARGLVYFKRGELERARSFMASAVAFREQAIAMEPGNMAVRNGLVSEASNLGATCLDLGQVRCAVEATTKAWQQLDFLQREDPQNAEATRSRANTALHHGRALAASHQPRAALEVLKLSESDLIQRAAASNAAPAVHTRLARARTAQAAALWQLGRRAEAGQAAQAARAGLLAVTEKSPNDPATWTWLGELAMLQAETVPAERTRWRAQARDAYAHSAALKPLVGVHLAAWQALGG
ncbi:MAG: serine/threonine-protein kinase [Ramlibacter sp.]